MNTPSRRRGRPKRDLVDGFRVQSWFNDVTERSGKTTAELAELFGSLNGKLSTANSGLWHKYARGAVAPGRDMLTRVDKAFPGTASWFDHPFWTVIREAPLSMGELLEIYKALDDEVQGLLLMHFRDNERPFWRRPTDDIDSLYGELLDLESIAGITAHLALIKEAETIQNQRQHLTGCLSWRFVAQLLEDFPIMDDLVASLDLMLSTRWARIQYSPDGEIWRTGASYGVIPGAYEENDPLNVSVIAWLRR
jgi:hypothetical protein